jgi:hypothetical protein
MVRLPRISQAGLVDLVCLVYLVGLVQPINKANQFNETDQTEDSVSISACGSTRQWNCEHRRSWDDLLKSDFSIVF